MRILVTGGNTAVHIDKVRVISNIFRGKTAVDIATMAFRRGHKVTLLGNPGMEPSSLGHVNKFLSYKTYDDLEELMQLEIQSKTYDCVVHSAAVSDYSVSRVLDSELNELSSSGKVGSSHKRIYLEMVPTRKIIDEIRPWGFHGILIKFKLQVDMTDGELLDIAKASRIHSNANLIVANCLEWAKERAFIVGPDLVQEVKRDDLSRSLLQYIESIGKT